MARKGLEKLMEYFSWKLSLGVVAASFLVATTGSTLLALLFMPEESTKKSKASARPSINYNVPNPVASLSNESVNLILKRNIFNAEIEESDSKRNDELQTPTDVAVKSDLPLRLIGTIFSGDPFSGIAIVENSSKRVTNSFMVGEEVASDAELVEIWRERIIIKRGVRREYIELEKKELARDRRKKKKATASSAPKIAPIATRPPPDSYKEEGFERKGFTSTMSEEYKNKLLSTDITKVLQDAKATPNMVDGALQGFKLTRIRQDSIYEKSGLQNNDIVEEVNGVPLTDTAQAIRLLQSLRNEKEIEIRVNRGGKIVNMTLSVL